MKHISVHFKVNKSIVIHICEIFIKKKEENKIKFNIKLDKKYTKCMLLIGN